jgi:hypothetical protein
MKSNIHMKLFQLVIIFLLMAFCAGSSTKHENQGVWKIYISVGRTPAAIGEIHIRQIMLISSESDHYPVFDSSTRLPRLLLTFLCSDR